MNYFEYFLMAFRVIRTKKMRSFLTMLGLIIGVASIVVIVALGEGNKQQIQQEIKKMGNDLVMLNANGANPIPEEVYALIRKSIPEIKDGAIIIQDQATIDFASNNQQINLVGVHPSFFSLTLQQLVAGRLLDNYDLKYSQKVCVVERSAKAQELYGLHARIGSIIYIQNTPFIIVGEIIHKENQFVYAENSIYVPLSTFRYVKTVIGFRQALFSAKTMAGIPSMISSINTLMTHNFKLDATQYNVQSLSQFLESAQAIVSKVTAIIGGIAGISLVVGGIGIMNIMLVSVTERTREIGLLKAIGAPQKAILSQFLIETMILSVVGGLIGIILGLGISVFVSHSMKLPIEVPLLPSAVGFTFSVVTGVASGFYPAYKASKLNPVDALRFS